MNCGLGLNAETVVAFKYAGTLFVAFPKLSQRIRMANFICGKVILKLYY